MLSNQVRNILILGSFSFIIYYLLRNPFSYGDPLIYADNILKHRFLDISIHIGYYLIGYLFYSFLGLFGCSINISLVIMSNVCGAAGIVYAYLLSEKLLNDR